LTKHVAPDDAYLKLHVTLEDADKLIAQNVKLSSGLGICGANVGSVKSMHKISAKHVVMKPAKISSIKTKLGKIMHKLYDLEPDSAPEKPLNVDLGVDLYQMEKY
jgi:hypothetical protein